ncbi:hypothetical protein [Williamsia phyllosphaerae]|uniref:Uncharacterized protein n=1 Tax=Williamsia phyllosphaerae TaxID=885042 RepID=A0ABQ1V4S5_9NOCA|nr:hypothetical protein [Williamsia phyllosphaerae]GGF38977.1 hypothetical protein GCM10007298_38340 [Williamsia phyllosphaerae]
MRLFNHTRPPRVRIFDSNGQQILIGTNELVDVIVREGSVHSYTSTSDDGSIGGAFINAEVAR